MSSVWHFGDSYGRMDDGVLYPSKHFVHLISDKLKYDYLTFCSGGISNEMIFNKILEQSVNFKKNDIVFINWSFFVRGTFWDDTHKKIRSTNVMYSEMENIKMNPKWDDSIIIKVLPLLDYYLENHKDYNMRLFTLINNFLRLIEKNGIKIFYVFADYIDYIDNLLNVGCSLKFENGFAKWLKINDFHKEEDLHYTYGIQIALCDMFYRKTNEFNTSEKSLFLNIGDLDKNLIYKKTKLL